MGLPRMRGPCVRRVGQRNSICFRRCWCAHSLWIAIGSACRQLDPSRRATSHAACADHQPEDLGECTASDARKCRPERQSLLFNRRGPIMQVMGRTQRSMLGMGSESHGVGSTENAAGPKCQPSHPSSPIASGRERRLPDALRQSAQPGVVFTVRARCLVRGAFPRFHWAWCPRHA